MIKNKLVSKGIFSGAVVLLLGGAMFSAFADNNKTADIISSEVKEVVTFGSYYDFDYSELKDNSCVIARVKVMDDLTEDNSVVNINKDNFIEGYYGKRKVEVIKYYKNEKNLGDAISIIEPAVLTEKNEYIHGEDYSKMEKGEEYIVFLSDDTASGDLSVLSANNGKIAINNLEDNEFKDIALKSLLEYETPESELGAQVKNEILGAEEVAEEEKVDLGNFEPATIETNLGEVEVNYFYNNDTKESYIDFNGEQLKVVKK